MASRSAALSAQGRGARRRAAVRGILVRPADCAARLWRGRLAAGILLAGLARVVGAQDGELAGDLPRGGDVPAATVEALLRQAEARQLHRQPTWLALLHYEPTLFRPTPASLADSGDFFLDPNGATDSRAEMEATLRAFAAPAETTVRGREHPQCVFPARYQWLKSQLDFDPRALPEVACAKFAEWRSAIHPVAATLVFPEAYMNNPSSMFGHTLLRFDAEEGGERRDLLAYAANFSADPAGDNAVSFTVKGLFGGYQGYFNVQPYYEKVSEYADWEARDLWEYELDLSAAQIDFLLEHLWELRGVGFDYYFFDENCSYQLLALLRVAVPDLVYWSRFQIWTAPSDTVRAVARDTGLLRRVRYRPSATTVLRHEAASLSSSLRRLALEIAGGTAGPADPRLVALPDDERALVLTVAYDDLRYSFVSDEVERKVAAERARRILVELSRVPHPEPLVAPPAPPALRPDQGHGTARAALGAGWRRGRPFVQAEVRPGYHDLLDPQGGYTAGAAIDFFCLDLRVYGDDGEVRLQNFSIVDVVSIAPRDDVFKPLSWRVGTRVLSLLAPGDGSSGIPGLEDAYGWRTDGGVGLAYELPGAALAYGFLLADADISGALRDSISAGGGAEVGVYFSFARGRWRTNLFSDVLEFAIGQQHTRGRWGLGQAISIGEQAALRFDVAATRDYGETWVEGLAALQVFF